MFMLSDQEFLDEMLRKVALRYKTESDFMRAINRSPQNMTNWKKRGVPAELKPVIAKELNIDWLEEHKNRVDEQANDYGDPATTRVLADIRRMASARQLTEADLDLLLVIARHMATPTNDAAEHSKPAAMPPSLRGKRPDKPPGRRRNQA